MNVLLVNLTRFGDLVQTQAVFSGLARQGQSTGLLCLENFRDAALLLRDINQRYALPGARLLRGLETAWPGAVADLERWAAHCLQDFQPDVVCNLTPTLSARLLCRYLVQEAAKRTGKLPQYTGFCLDEAGFGRDSSPWASFLMGATKARGVSPFNIVDIFRKISATDSMLPQALLARPSGEALAAAEERLRAHMPPEAAGAAGFIALQPGASEERRRWPTASFAALATTVWREAGLVPLLLGSQEERELSEAVAAGIAGPSINLAGETSLPELAAILSLCRLLVSNDTGTMHLAAGLDIPVLAVFLATAQPWDTGPYRSGCCSLEPDLPCHPCPFGQECPHEFACRFSVSPELAAELVLGYARTNSWNAGNASLVGRGARIWQSAHDEHGLMDLISLSGHEKADRTLWLREQRHFYRQFLDRDPGTAFSPDLPVSSLPFSVDFTDQLGRELTTAITLLDALEQQGSLLLAKPLAPIKERFFSSLARMDSLLRESRSLAALSLLWLGDMHEKDDLGAVVHLASQYKTLLMSMRSRLQRERP